MGWRRGQALDQDLRDRVLAAEGGPCEVARRFGVSSSYVTKARQRRDRLGDVLPGAQRSHTPAKLAGHDDALRAEVARRPDATLAELGAWVLGTLGISVSVSGLCLRLKRLGLTLKKSRLRQPSRNGPMSPTHGVAGRR
jgi:transposase